VSEAEIRSRLELARSVLSEQRPARQYLPCLLCKHLHVRRKHLSIVGNEIRKTLGRAHTSLKPYATPLSADKDQSMSMIWTALKISSFFLVLKAMVV